MLENRAYKIFTITKQIVKNIFNYRKNIFFKNHYNFDIMIKYIKYWRDLYGGT